jgi:hypothetical protein
MVVDGAANFGKYRMIVGVLDTYDNTVLGNAGTCGE